MSPITQPQQLVLLVHGLGGSRLDMWPISRRLTGSGYATCNWGYVSVGFRIEQHARRLAEDLRMLQRDPRIRQIHLVTHSLGAIIARQALAETLPDKVSRVIMLAPPNRGSHVARSFPPG